MPSDVMAATPKQRKMAKRLDHIRITESENGGHSIEHHYTSYEHPPEMHVFGKGESQAAHEHIAKHMNMPLKFDKEAAAGTEENVGAKEAAQL